MAENITAHMDKSLESLKHNFSKVRTGRANANILSDISVDYYGVPTPVTQVAAVKTPEAHMLLIEPWDKALVNAIVKAISASDLGITPNSDGTVVRLPFPAPTEERRRELVKECREYAEQAKVSIRNIRRDFNNKLERDEELTEDDVRRGDVGVAAEGRLGEHEQLLGRVVREDGSRLQVLADELVRRALLVAGVVAHCDYPLG